MEKILVIEDTKSLIDEIDFILKMEGFEVIAADNGISGVEMALKFKPDLILCDILMPGLDGFGVIQDLKSKDKLFCCAFIFMTALSERKDYREGMELGADDYLVKPFSVDELLKAVNTQLSKYKSLDSRIKSQIEIIEEDYHFRMLELNVKIDKQQADLNDISDLHGIVQDQLNEKQAQLMQEALRSIEINSTMQEMAKQLSTELNNKNLTNEYRNTLLVLRNKIKKKSVLLNNSAIFQLKFDLTYPNVTAMLINKYPILTRMDRLIISAFLTNLDTTQLSVILNIQPSSVRKYKYRIKKKIGLGRDEDFYRFFVQLIREENGIL
jgi:two-component system, OmpR family, alkaline phosphatase synthesis response regulator PhoP